MSEFVINPKNPETPTLKLNILVILVQFVINLNPETPNFGKIRSNIWLIIVTNPNSGTTILKMVSSGTEFHGEPEIRVQNPLIPAKSDPK